MCNVCVQVCKQLRPLIGAQQEDQRHVAAMLLLRSLLVADLSPKHPSDPTLCCPTLSDFVHQANAGFDSLLWSSRNKWMYQGLE